MELVHLEYTNLELTGTLASTTKGTGNFDLMVPGTEADVFCIGSISSTTVIPTCTLSKYDNKTVAIDYILVDYDGTNSPDVYKYLTGSVFGEYLRTHYYCYYCYINYYY